MARRARACACVLIPPTGVRPAVLRRSGVLLVGALLAASSALGAQTSVPSQDNPTTAPPVGTATLRGTAPQESAPRTAPGPGTTFERPAIVNGEAITAEDVASYARLLDDESAELPEAQRIHLARRSVAEEILMAAEASRVGIALTDREVDDYWTQRRGAVPDYAAFAEATGTTVERQRDLARRSAQAELYLLHRVGFRSELARAVPPDPLLVQLVTVTPTQLRAAFNANRSFFDTPEAVNCDIYPCADADTAIEVSDALAGSVAVPPVTAMQRSYPLAQLGQLFPPVVASFLAQAEAGAVQTFPVTEGSLVLQVTGRRPGKAAEFGDSQERLRRMLQNELLTDARRQVVADLAEHATYWPDDLFSLTSVGATPGPSGTADAAAAGSPAAVANPTSPP